MKDESSPSSGAPPASRPRPSPPDRRATRAAVWATVGIVVILGAALFIGTVLGPFLQTRAVIKRSCVSQGGSPPVNYYYLYQPSDEATPLRSKAWVIEHLGGRKQAFRQLRLYLRLPDWAAPDKSIALYLVGSCGPEAVPLLVEALDDPAPGVRRIAVLCLGQLAPDVAEALPYLEKATRDEDQEVRSIAEWALKKIRGGE